METLAAAASLLHLAGLHDYKARASAANKPYETARLQEQVTQYTCTYIRWLRLADSTSDGVAHDINSSHRQILWHPRPTLPTSHSIRAVEK